MDKVGYGISLEISDAQLRKQIVQYLRARGIRVRRERERALVLARGDQEETARAVHALIDDFLTTLPDPALVSIRQSDRESIMLKLERVEDAHDSLPLTHAIIADRHPFCDIGSLLALNWMRTAALSVEKLGLAEDEAIRRAVLEALDGLLVHRHTCEVCLERHSSSLLL